MKEPTADKGSGNLLQYIASVTKLMQISVVLIMVTSVGFWRIETAVTINQNAINVRIEDSSRMHPETIDTDEGEVSNLFTEITQQSKNIMFSSFFIANIYTFGLIL